MNKVLLSMILSLVLYHPALADAPAPDYERFLAKIPEFKALDAELNQSYKNIISTLPNNEKILFRNDQREWIRDGFNSNYYELVHQLKSPEETALAVLKMRIDDLKKMSVDSSNDDIAGLPLRFGMMKSEVMAKLAHLPYDKEDDCYTLQTMGEDATVSLIFSKTVFESQIGQDDDKLLMENFVEGYEKKLGIKLERRFAKKGSANMMYIGPLEKLVGVSISFSDTKLDRNTFNKKFSAKYKRIFDREDLEKLISIRYGSSPTIWHDSNFETKDRIIYTTNESGTMVNAFSVTYFDKQYLANTFHPKTITPLLENPQNLKNDMLFFQRGDDLFTVLKKLEGCTISPSLYGPYVSFEEFGVYLKFRGDKLNAIEFCNLNDNNYADKLVARYQKSLNKFGDDKLICDYLEYCTNQDNYFDAGSNYVIVGLSKYAGMFVEIVPKENLELVISDHKTQKALDDARKAEDKEKYAKDLDKF